MRKHKVTTNIVLVTFDVLVDSDFGVPPFSLRISTFDSAEYTFACCCIKWI